MNSTLMNWALLWWDSALRAATKYLHSLSDFRFLSQNCFKIYHDIKFQRNWTTCTALYILKALKNFKIPSKIKKHKHTNDHNVLYHVPLLQHCKAQQPLTKSTGTPNHCKFCFQKLSPVLPALIQLLCSGGSWVKTPSCNTTVTLPIAQLRLWAKLTLVNGFAEYTWLSKQLYSFSLLIRSKS